MRQFQVPQFIDIEDKIIGPLTIRQFLYLVGGGAIDVVAFYTLPYFFLFLLIAIPVSLFALAMAFYVFNQFQFRKNAANALIYSTKPHLYLWKQLPPETKKQKAPGASLEANLYKTPTLTDSKLQDLAWSLDIKEKLE